jgi:hypothetical protein
MRTTIGRGAIYKVPGKYADTASLHVTFNPNTITVDGYRYLDGDMRLKGTVITGGDDVYFTSHQTYSGYTLAECLCKSLIDMQIVEEWADAIMIIEEMGVPYVTDETLCDSCEENLPLTHNPATGMWHCDECAD